MAEVIRLVDIVKSYIMGDSVVHALDHVNVQIGEGEFTSIMGPSGSGKRRRTYGACCPRSGIGRAWQQA